jgi:DNA-binding GntR family transcriptional regulator
MPQSRIVVSIAAARERRAARKATSTDTKAASYAADAIRARIIEGLLSPGQRLIEADLMAELDVGRSTIREAFLRLDADGFVELRHQRGAVVRRLTRNDMADLFAIRERLEALAAALCAERFAANQATKLDRDWLAAQRKLWRSEQVRANSLQHMDENVNFHRGLILMSGNGRLLRMLEPLQVPGYRMQFLQLSDAVRRKISAAEHVAIIDAILDGHAAKVERLMREHVQRAGKLAQALPGLLE